jgi:hypothetical protein
VKAVSTFGAMSQRTFEEEWTCCGWGGFFPILSLSSLVRSMKVTCLFLDAFELVLGTVSSWCTGNGFVHLKQEKGKIMSSVNSSQFTFESKTVVVHNSPKTP